MKSDLSLTSLIAILEKTAPVISSTRLDEIFKRVEVGEEEIKRYGFFSDTRYARNLVYKNDKFEVMMMCWKNGQRSSIHDHAGSLGGAKVIRGSLTESLFGLAPNGMIKSLASDDCFPGKILIEETSLIHQISNLQAGHRDAVSLHIYLPPLVRMNVFSLYDTSVKTVLPRHFIFGAGI